MLKILNDWLDKRKAEQHIEVKNKILLLKAQRSMLIIDKHPFPEIDRIDRKLKRMEKKLNKGMMI